MTEPQPNDLALLTPAEMDEADQLTALIKVDNFKLMDAAGAAVAVAIGARWLMRPVTVLCGPGNNGGDGFVTARHLAEAGWPVRVALLGRRENLEGSAARACNQWTGPLEAFDSVNLNDNSVVVDAIFGSGLSRPVTGVAGEVIEAITARRMQVCAIDVPSGLDGARGVVLGTAAPAAITVTFFRKKPAHLLFPGRALCGDVVLADIGIPVGVLDKISPTTWENGMELWLNYFPWPQLESYKYKRGEVLILGGEEITGASRLTALAAGRAGAGMVTLAAPAISWKIYATALTNAIVRRFDGLSDFRSLLTDSRRNVIAIGPGAGVGAQTRQYVLDALATKRAVVLDADALTSFAEAPEQLFSAIAGACVLTPHAGEFLRLFHFEGDKLLRTRRAARLSGATVVFKGPDTVIAAPDGRAIINANAPPQLATGGTGDVLTGIVAALLAQGMSPFEAAAAGVWLHGAAADEFGIGLVAADLPDALPSVLQKLKARVQ